MVSRRPIVALAALAAASCALLTPAGAFSPLTGALPRCDRARSRAGSLPQPAVFAHTSFSGGLVSGHQSLHHGEQPFGARQLRARGISKLRPSVGLRMCEGANSETGKDEERVSRVDAALSAAVNKTQESFNKSVEKGEAKEAVRMMRSTEGLTVTLEQAGKLLSSIPLELSAETETEQQILTSITYSALRKRGLLKGFGCVESTPFSLPFAKKEINVESLEEVIGMPIQALTPKGSQFAWQFAGLALCAGEYFLGRELGIDPLRTLIPATSLLFILDRALLSGAVFEAAYRTLFPQYREKVIRHEAGHFLLAYLLGCPIQGFFLSAWDANRVGIRGQAGTVFFDNDLSTQLTANKVTRTAIDRYTIVLMGGIAAEAMTYQQAEGGAGDESALVNFLVALTPPWDQPRVLNQARWAVTEAVLLLREHKGCYDALTKCMESNKGLGECVLAIEAELEKLPALPAVERAAERRAAREAELGVLGEESDSERSADVEAREVGASVETKMAQLDALTAEEERLRDEIRQVAARVSAEEAAGSSGAWSSGETERFMAALLTARRKEKARESGAGSELDAALLEATRSRDLAKVELDLARNKAALAAVEKRLEAAVQAETARRNE